ncbi:Monooxygenase aflX [Lasiodiplodia theobromae]|uniref:Monooxygenase aflX n=1 Tax=Lasiodiplodia theobromae TaxID=45133 RepID=A0A5N5D834_9PEZI|nr:Monooxygenase aflX [Lasiodiplodia theobromae]
MITYAILGATGSTGSELFKLLHKRNDVHLNIYARSQSRLDSICPESRNSSHVTRYIGDMNDTHLLVECLRGTSAVFATVAQNNTEPNCSLAVRSAQQIVKALEVLRDESKGNGQRWKCPTVVYISSSTINDKLNALFPPLVYTFIHTSLYDLYEDISNAQKYLRMFPWIPVIFPQPGAIVQDPKSYGVRLSETNISMRIGYTDVAEGMILLVEGKECSGDTVGDPEKWIGKEVGLVSLGGEQVAWTGFPSNLFKNILPGFLCTFLPSVWRLGRKAGLW